MPRSNRGGATRTSSSLVVATYVLGGALTGLALMLGVLYVAAVPAPRPVEVVIEQTRAALDAAGFRDVWWNAVGDR